MNQQFAKKAMIKSQWEFDVYMWFDLTWIRRYDQNLSNISYCTCDSLAWNSHNINNFNIGWWSSVKWPHLLIHSTRYGCSVNLHWSHCTTITSWDSTVDKHTLQILICLEHLFVCLFLTVGTQWTYELDMDVTLIYTEVTAYYNIMRQYSWHALL